MKASWAVAAFAALVMVHGHAAGDAVPPAPDDCPSGKVGVTSHSGPECVDAAPTDCPPGWRGVVGGTCAVAVCQTDAECGADHACREQPVCFEEHQRDRGWRGEPLEPPTKEWVAVNVCGADADPCPAPASCRPGKLCVPRSGAIARPMPRQPDGTIQTKPSGCGGCASSRVPAGLAGALLAAGVAVFFARRRRA